MNILKKLKPKTTRTTVFLSLIGLTFLNFLCAMTLKFELFQFLALVQLLFVPYMLASFVRLQETLFESSGGWFPEPTALGLVYIVIITLIILYVVALILTPLVSGTQKKFSFSKLKASLITIAIIIVVIFVGDQLLYKLRTISYEKENPIQVGMIEVDLTGEKPLNDRASMKSGGTLQFADDGMVVWAEHTEHSPPYRQNKWHWYGFDANEISTGTVEVKKLGRYISGRPNENDLYISKSWKKRESCDDYWNDAYYDRLSFLDCYRGYVALIYDKKVEKTDPSDWALELREATTNRIEHTHDLDDETFNSWTQAKAKIVADVMYYQSDYNQISAHYIKHGGTEIILEVDHTITDWDIKDDLIVYVQKANDGSRYHGDIYLYQMK